MQFFVPFICFLAFKPALYIWIDLLLSLCRKEEHSDGDTVKPDPSSATALLIKLSRPLFFSIYPRSMAFSNHSIKNV